jgi:hypothetical protein
MPKINIIFISVLSKVPLQLSMCYYCKQASYVCFINLILNPNRFNSVCDKLRSYSSLDYLENSVAFDAINYNRQELVILNNNSQEENDGFCLQQLICFELNHISYHLTYLHEL